MRVTVADIVARLGGECVGDAALVVDRIAALDAAGPSQISFLSHPRYRTLLQRTAAGCVIVAPALAEEAAQRGTVIVTPDPYLYYARLSQWWAAQASPAAAGVHPSAVVEAGATIGPGASIGALSYIGTGAVVGAGTRIGARVTLGERCVVGERCILHSGVVIGADGFGFAPHEGRWEKIAQLGAVRIGNDVEIGANTCVDRGALGDTVIEDGVKLDNLIQVGHNVHIGAHSAMAGCVGIAGSARIGRRCTVGGGAIVLGHLELADDVHITAASVVSRSILKPGQYSGMFPIDDNASWEKNAATLRQLHTLRERLRALEKKLA
ncbi:MAG TPA: UDP-3-O-(3-hydroxymyristoyl)glucosamine N-acyltransferase [Burkholderiaceae bacterium]|nr:UDP-3-O-(3-hydroxymyristoyl)glucosamine N-acyltransferase [Burkholderiaceae bacterium]